MKSQIWSQISQILIQLGFKITSSMQSSDSLSIIFQSKANFIPLKFDLLDNISPSISHSLVLNPNHEYTVKSKVSEAVFQSFLEHWLKGTPSDIQIYNIDEYIQLNQEFQFKQLDTLLKSKEEEFGEDLQYFNCIKSQNHADQSNSEEKIATRLDDYLKRYKTEIMKLPITSLYNIFNHHHRKLQDHNYAYELIKNHFEITGDSNIFSLLPSLDGAKLSKENLKESISQQESRFGYHPTFDVAYLTNAVEMQKKQESKIIEIEEKIGQQQKCHDDLYQKFTSSIEKLGTETENQKQNINELKDVSKDQSKLINELVQKTKDQSKMIEEMKKTDEIKNQIISELKETTKVQSNSIDDLIKTTKNANKSIEQLKSTVDTQSKEINDLKKAINDQNDTITKLKKAKNNQANEISSFKDKNSLEITSIKSTINQTIYNALELIKNNFVTNDCLQFDSFQPDLKKPGILCKLKEKEENPFDPYFVVSLSSNDIYSIIDPSAKGQFSTSKEGNFFIEYRFKEKIEINGIQIFNSYKDFPKSFDIEIEGEIVKSITDAVELNGKYKKMTINFKPVKSAAIKFIQKGKNWDENNNFLVFKRIEILSNEPKYSQGVFSTIVGQNENGDMHKIDFHIISSCFDFNSFYMLDSKRIIWTLCEDNSWFQVEFTKGLAILYGFRLKKNEYFKLKSYKIIGTYDSNNPIDKWEMLYSINENSLDENANLFIQKFKNPSLPVKIIRIVNTGDNWSNNKSLSFYHFDLFGIYL